MSKTALFHPVCQVVALVKKLPSVIAELFAAFFSKDFVLCDADKSAGWTNSTEVAFESKAVTASRKRLSSVFSADAGCFYQLIVYCLFV